MALLLAGLLILLVALVAVGYARAGPAKEHFDEATAASAAPSSVYSNRLYVIRIFDTMFNRNPTHNELEIYSSGAATEKEVLDRIVKDYEKLRAPAQEVVRIDGFTLLEEGLKGAEQAVKEKEKEQVVATDPVASSPPSSPPSSSSMGLKQRLRAIRTALDEAIDSL